MFKMFKKKTTREMVGTDKKDDKLSRESKKPNKESPLKAEISEIEQPVKKKGKNEKPRREKRTFHGLPFKSLLHNRTVLGAASILIALIVAFVLTPLAEAAMSRNVKVVRLVSDVRRGAVITKDQVEKAEVGAFGLSKDTVYETDDVIGKYAAIDMMSGDVVTAKKIADQPRYDDQYLAELPEGKMAISVQLKSLAEGLSGKLRAGDVVRVFSYMKDAMDTSNYSAMSLPELQYVEVLSVTNPNVKDIENGGDAQKDAGENQSEEKQIATITLAVNSNQASILAGLNNCAEIHVALVSRGNEEAKQQLLKTQDEYFRG